MQAPSGFMTSIIKRQEYYLYQLAVDMISYNKESYHGSLEWNQGNNFDAGSVESRTDLTY